ncbi:hypothetical protein SAMN05428995_103157 [Loktanella sp. DSM 29012]|uniref:Tetratricopeptide repeat-like domain-containing protein n=1 Tax=Loktanella gaetbuli TaxID=2881335 RepID=A0ABS8BQT7_9RHOB|nr:MULTISPECIES: hypothetical protein [Loktanella]MCB5197896.1 hypothetical protein [Loktanella gaetbuli]SEQ18877.1 hypothetical protein SAMN05428995_103157 [Loktanella sp. DSM 29012]
MSDTDSFINEVTEEVRRDRLYGLIKRYGWIAILAVVLLVGGAAWIEYTKARDMAAAQAKGDAVLAALEQDDPAARAAALAQVEGQGPARAVVDLLEAATQLESEEAVTATQTLQALALNGDVPQVYRDLASFKAAVIGGELDMATRRQTLENLASPGQPFSLLAQEQLALMDLADGDSDAAVAKLTALIEDAGATRGLRDRAQTLMVALGAPVPDTIQSE